MTLTKKLTLYGMLISLGIIASFIENLIPVNLIIPIPGVKLGLANAFVVITLYMFGARGAFCVSVIRILLSSFLFGGLNVLLYSLSGGIISFLVMILIKRCKIFSIIGVSAMGGIFHTVTQVLVASLVVSNIDLLFLLPILLVSGVVTGIFVGFISMNTLKHLK